MKNLERILIVSLLFICTFNASLTIHAENSDDEIVIFDGNDYSERDLTNEETEIAIWNHLLNYIGNPYAVAGIMGNLYAESKLRSVNLEGKYEKQINMTDQDYTAAVDSGSYSKDKFVNDRAGYGIAQWTLESRKQNLYEYLVEKGTSISDLSGQLDFLCFELTSYVDILDQLKNIESIRDASNLILFQFERPKDKSQSAQDYRAKWSQTFYDKYSDWKPEEIIALDFGQIEEIEPSYPF